MNAATDPVITIAEARANCERFAREHKLVFEDHGEVGFGRAAVGFTHGDNYVDYAPLNFQTYDPLPEFDGEQIGRAAPPHAYHKHPCLAVLVYDDDYDAAIRELDQLVRAMEAGGALEIMHYRTGAVGLQALISGVVAVAIRYRRPARDARD